MLNNMCFRYVRVVGAVVLACCLAVHSSTARSADPEFFLSGAATVDITPQAGVSLDGTISKNGPVVGIHDRLCSRAVVMQLGSTKVAIVVNDACFIGRPVFDRAKEMAHRSTGIPVAAMLMSATHTHAAVRAARIGTGPLDDQYHEFLARQIAAAVAAADKNLAPAKVGFGSFDKPDLFACRRFVCEQGSVSANPFGESGEQVKSVSGSSKAVRHPAGPIDPQFCVLSLRHRDGTPLAVLANFNAHYCGGYRRGWVSADYFGAFSRRLEQDLATDSPHPPPVAMLSNGTSGDAGAVSVPGKFAPFEKLERIGRQLADETRDMLAQIEYGEPEQLASLYSEIELGVRRPDDARVAWARAILAEPASKHAHRWTPIYAQETLELQEYPERYRIPLQAIRIGRVGIAAIPCEVFGETGLAIKKESPLEYTFTMELANGYSGYLPTPAQHQLGGYETWPARSSHLEVEAEPRIRTEVLRMLNELSK